MTQSNLKIAITGGIGSGKSTVSAIIAEQGYSVISCDEIYKSLLSDSAFLHHLSNEFGDILNPEGLFDGKKLASIVFADKNKLKKLNELTHPAIMDEVLVKISVEGVCFCEVPLLFEGGYEKLFDKIIVVLRDKKLRASSVAVRDKKEESEVIVCINSQFDYDNSSFEKYYVIHNDSDLINLRTQTINIINEIIKK